jgi:hypothetical protein
MTKLELENAVITLMNMDDNVHWLETNLPEEFQKQVANMAKKIASLQGTINHRLQYLTDEEINS